MGKDLPALKAISQNLMHSNISITDGVYGNLSENDVKRQIAALGQKKELKSLSNIEELISTNRKILEKLELNNK